MAVTAFYAALITFLYLALSARVIARRGAAKVSLGDGGDPRLTQAIRRTPTAPNTRRSASS